MIAFSVPGTPVAWQRAGTKGGRFYTKRKTVEFENRVRLFATTAGVRPLDGPVSLAIYAWWPMRGGPRKRVPRPAEWKATRPDVDNLAKCVCDALNGIAYKDDGQVAKLTVHTFYAGQEGTAHTLVEIRSLAGEEMPDA